MNFLNIVLESIIEAIWTNYLHGESLAHRHSY